MSAPTTETPVEADPWAAPEDPPPPPGRRLWRVWKQANGNETVRRVAALESGGLIGLAGYLSLKRLYITLRDSKRRSSLLGVGTALTILGALMVGFLADATVVGRLRHDRDRQTAYASLRYNLANGTTPTGAYDIDGKPVREGTPMALLEIPSIGLREVVRYGTTPGDLMSGPGLRRDTVLPGQAGGSVIMARRALYGGPFQYLDQLQTGIQFKVTTGQGESTFKVVDVRRPGDPIPPQFLAAPSRLVLVTTSGNPYLPEDLLRVDAVLVDDANVLPTGSVSKPQPGDEALSTDRSAWVPLVLWGQALVLAAIAVTWLRGRWGGRQAWLVGSPLLLALGLAVADTAARLLPNVM
ncbi:sortase [Catenulispora subtropica]|uniref:Sortase n=1 Tax=Catenulispora subtropica TaxID=450798 RepID=A0ABP5BMR3_9ACTN